MFIAEKEVELVEVIRTTLTRAGDGTTDNPIRRVTEYWTLEGERLATVDDHGPTHCNAVGHRVWPGADKCAHCHARIKDGRMP